MTSFFVYAFFINQFVQLGSEKGMRFGDLFDTEMKPQLANDIGEEALRRYADLTKFMPKDLAPAMPWDVGRQIFFDGRVAQANWWTDMPKGAADPKISRLQTRSNAPAVSVM